MPKISKAQFSTWRIYIWILLVGMMVSGCGGNGGENSGETVNPEEANPAVPGVIEETKGPSDSRVVFFVMKNGNAEVGEKVEELLHNQMAWLEEGNVRTMSADSTLEAFQAAAPTFDFPRVHKFFSTRRTNELRAGDVLKVQLSWQEKHADGRASVSTRLYANRNSTWTAVANPGTFNFPSDAQWETDATLFSPDELAAEIAQLIVTLSYK